MTKLITKCPVTGKPVTLRANCPGTQLRQILKFALTPTDAVIIAEYRYTEARTIWAARTMQAKLSAEASIADAIQIRI